MSLLHTPRGRLLFTGQQEIDVVCPAITPATAADLVANGGMETGDPPSSWTLNSGATLAGAADERTGGAGAQSLSVTRGTNNLAAYQALTVAAAMWVLLDSWRRKVTANALVGVGTEASATESWSSGYSTSTSWGQSQARFMVLTANSRVHLYAQTSGEARYDDISILPYTLASTTALLGQRGSRPGTYTCLPTVADNTQAGILIAYADALNYVLAIVDRLGTDQAKLWKVVAGTPTLVTSGNITYSAAAQLKVIVNGTSYSLYYNGSQVDTTQAIVNAGLGLSVYGFNTAAGNTVGQVTTSPATS